MVRMVLGLAGPSGRQREGARHLGAPGTDHLAGHAQVVAVMQRRARP